ncbi:hypothetical protein ACSBR1_024423 [Camellia fascicularis]
MHEITFSIDDKPKLLSQLTALLGEVGLNIQEAHVFSTVDGYSLDAFVVDGWPYEALDFVVSEAWKYKIRLILSLTNNWDAYGGKAQYVKWG